MGSPDILTLITALHTLTTDTLVRIGTGRAGTGGMAVGSFIPTLGEVRVSGTGANQDKKVSEAGGRNIPPAYFFGLAELAGFEGAVTAGEGVS